MNHPKLKIKPYKNKDKKQAKLLEEYINYQFYKYEDVITSIEKARHFIYIAYGIETPNNIWDKILEAVVKKDINEEIVDK